MKTKIIALLLFSIAIIGCKGDGQEEKKESVNTELDKGNDFFTITLDLIAQKDDSFHIYYSEDKTENFTEENSIWQEFKGSTNSQKLLFNLPKDRFPTNLRIDFGVNKDQQEIKIKGMEVTYKEKKVNINGFDLLKFFRINYNITTFDAENQMIKAKSEGKDYVGASIYSLEPMAKQLESLLK
jgi:hypothetical protein